MKVIYNSPIGLSVVKHDWQEDFTITGNAKQSMTVVEFESAYDFEEFVQKKVNCEGIIFDSEFCQFFANAKTEKRAVKFVKDIENHFSKLREML